jgi:hypothetical protein
MGFKTRPSKVVLQHHFEEAIIAVLGTQDIAFLGDEIEI